MPEHRCVSPKFGLIAEAYNIAYIAGSKSLTRSTPALQQAMDHQGPILLEFICDASEVILPMIPSDGGFDDMIVARPDTEKTGNRQKQGRKIMNRRAISGLYARSPGCT